MEGEAKKGAGSRGVILPGKFGISPGGPDFLLDDPDPSSFVYPGVFGLLPARGVLEVSVDGGVILVIGSSLPLLPFDDDPVV